MVDISKDLNKLITSKMCIPEVALSLILHNQEGALYESTSKLYEPDKFKSHTYNEYKSNKSVSGIQ